MKRLFWNMLLLIVCNIMANGQNYKEVKIGNSIWMAENLNNPVKGSWCYNDDKLNASKYGRLYSWEAAKNACPTGWHLPAEKEWNQLIEFAGGNSKAGKLLKTGGDLGFNAPLGGFSNVGGFNLLNFYGTYWSSTEYDSEHAWYIFFTANDDLATKTYFTKTYGLSVRCVKNK